MQIRATIKKLFNSYTLSELCQHMSNELEAEAQYLITVGAPMRANYLRKQAGILNQTKRELENVEY